MILDKYDKYRCELINDTLNDETKDFSNIDVDIEEDTLKLIDVICKDNNISRDVYITLALTQSIYMLEKKRILEEGEFKNVVDMAEFALNIEELNIEEEVFYIFNNSDIKKPVVSMPHKDYEKAQEIINKGAK